MEKMQTVCRVGTHADTSIGRALFATRNISAGTAALTIDKPLITALDTAQVHATCANCFTWTANSSINDRGAGQSQASQPVVKACTGCQTLRYCSRKCQAESWKRGHKKVCPLFGRLREKGTLPNAARAVLDMLQILPPGFSAWGAADNPFREMRSHRESILANGGDRAQQLLVLSTGVHSYSGTAVGLEVVQHLFALVYTNSLTLYTSTFDALGIVLDPQAAAANHSCDANTAVVFGGQKLEFRALRGIGEGEEITISYVDGTDPAGRRQRLLKERFYFDCQCVKCLKAKEISINSDQQEVEDYGYSVLDKAGKQDRGELLPRLLKAMELCLATPVWEQHATRQPLPALRQEIFTSLLLTEQWVEAFKMGLKIYFQVHPEIYGETSWHPTRVVHKWTLACLALQLASLNDQPDGQALSRGASSNAERLHSIDDGGFWGTVIIGLLTEVLDNVRLSHGEESSFAKIVKLKMAEVAVDVTRGDQGKLGEVKAMMGEVISRSCTGCISGFCLHCTSATEVILQTIAAPESFRLANIYRGRQSLFFGITFVCYFFIAGIVCFSYRSRRVNADRPQGPTETASADSGTNNIPSALRSKFQTVHTHLYNYCRGLYEDNNKLESELVTLQDELAILRRELNTSQTARRTDNEAATLAIKTNFLLNEDIRRLRLQLIMAPNGKTYSEEFVTALIASFMARDGKTVIDNKALAKFATMLGDDITATAAEHRTRNMKKRAQQILEQSRDGGGRGVRTPTSTPSATPKKRSASGKKKTAGKKQKKDDFVAEDEEEVDYEETPSPEPMPSKRMKRGSGKRSKKEDSGGGGGVVGTEEDGGGVEDEEDGAGGGEGGQGCGDGRFEVCEGGVVESGRGVGCWSWGRCGLGDVGCWAADGEGGVWAGYWGGLRGGRWGGLRGGRWAGWGGGRGREEYASAWPAQWQKLATRHTTARFASVRQKSRSRIQLTSKTEISVSLPSSREVAGSGCPSTVVGNLACRAWASLPKAA
ncbi:hypothetical protein FH972_024150 [Carpinus fangiana]|uniref:MYND-type domain-containing protein n=1 Tax=Carpinus fangiana TaxID=176857 RepID=A0A5N6KXW7_9ROSI|nr:hypothetical protein FH972_024150 [Carpinus fangiana]